MTRPRAGAANVPELPGEDRPRGGGQRAPERGLAVKLFTDEQFAKHCAARAKMSSWGPGDVA